MDTKTNLMNSAERFVRKQGYNGFSYADLAKEVGIRKASIHHHFPAKSDLALAIMVRYRRFFFEALDHVMHTHQHANTRLRAYIEIYRNAVEGGDTLCLCVAFSINRESLSNAVLAEVDRFHEESVLWLKDIFELGRQDGTIAHVNNPSDEAAACLALVEGGQLSARVAISVDKFDRAVRQLEGRLSAS